MANMRSITLALLVADIISAVLFAVFTYSTDESGLRGPDYLVVLLLLGMAFSFVGILILAVPAFLALRYLRSVNLWSTLTVGFIIGAGMAGFTEWPHGGLNGLIHVNWRDHAVQRIVVFGVIGAIAAFGFWFVWKRTATTPQE